MRKGGKEYGIRNHNLEGTRRICITHPSTTGGNSDFKDVLIKR